MQTVDHGKAPLVLGGSGRVGRMLARVWPEGSKPLWQRRAASAPLSPDDLVWDILSQDPPDLPRPVTAVIVLAGVTGGDDLHLNTSLARAGCDLAHRLGVRCLVASSQAVYGQAVGALSEDMEPEPATPYGHAKYAMEQALAGRPKVTCLRIGNVAGADGLFGAMARGQITLDRFADGRAPRRMMIGPRDLAQILAALCDWPHELPAVLNVAAPGLIAMDQLAAAAKAQWDWRPASEGALPALELDLRRLMGLIPLEPAIPSDLVAQAIAGGWQVAT